MIYKNFLCALWLAGSLASASAETLPVPGLAPPPNAPKSMAKTKLSPARVRLAGVVSIAELAKQAPGPVRQVRPVRKIEMPRHRLPNGSLTAAKPMRPVIEKLAALRPNVQVAAPILNITGFQAIHSLDNDIAGIGELEPPDQGLAVNSNVVAEINNEVLQFFNARSGVPLTLPIALPSFFLSGNSCGDPQAFFDPTIQRWFFMEMASNACGGSGAVGEGFDIAVSRTADPLGSYFIYHIEAFSGDLAGCAGSDCLPDYPKAGFDKNGFYISVNLFNVATTGDFVEAATYALPKSKLKSGAGFAYLRIDYPDDFVVQPSVPAPGEPFAAAANGTEFLMEARNIVDGSNNIRVWAISNTNNIVSNILSLRAFFVNIAAQAYGPTAPATEPNVVGPYCASKGVLSAPQLDGGYQSFQATIQKAGGKLYGALPFNSPDGKGLDRDAIAWFVLTPSVNSLGQPSAAIDSQGYVIPPNGYSLLYPALGLNKSGTGALGFTITNTSQSVLGGFPSAAFIQFSKTGPVGSIRVTGQGQTSDDGFSGCPGPGPGTVGRWGDYGAAVVDAKTGYFYTANENISGPRGFATNWGTFITRMNILSP